MFSEAHEPFTQLNDEYAVPDAIKKFVVSFRKHVRDRNVYEIMNQYEVVFPKHTENFFKASAWPAPELIAKLVEGDEVFLCLYKDLYYRHIYANRDLVQTTENRAASFENYINIFNILLGKSDDYEVKLSIKRLQKEQPDDNPTLNLPSHWLWDIILTFVHNFQEFHAYRSLIAELNDDDVAELKSHPDAWNCSLVLRFMHALVAKGRIPLTFGAGLDQVAEVEFNPSTTSHTVGCFSLVGLAYLYMLFGDYVTAVEMLEKIDVQKQTLTSRVLSCHVTVYYTLGVAYLMMRRPADAINKFAAILTLASHIHVPTSFMFESVTAMTSSIQVLLAVSISVFPAYLEDEILSAVKELYAEEMAAIIAGSEETLLKMFVAGAPPYISPATPDFESRIPVYTNALELQLRVFQHEMAHIRSISKLYDLLKLYTSIPVRKLAAALDTTFEKLVSQLVSARSTMRDANYISASNDRGEPSMQAISMSSLDFYVDGDVVHVVHTKHQPRFRDEFLHGINRVGEMIEDIARIP